MAVSQVNNTQTIVKLALAKKGIKTGQKQKLPEYLQMSGSIFKAPGVVQTQIVGMNTQKSIQDLQENKQPTYAFPPKAENTATPTPTSTNKTESSESEEPKYDTSVSGGKQAISDAKDIQGKAEDLTATTEKHEKVVTKFANSAAKLTKETTNDDKKFVREAQVQQAQVQKDNAKIQKLIRENEETEKELDDAQRELETYMGSSGSTNETSGGNPGRTGELRAIIGAKVGLLQKNGKSIYSLQRSSSRSLSRMNRAQRNYIKAQKVKAKEVSNQQNETSDVLKVAQEVEKWSAVAQSSGQALGLLGKMFVAIGSSTSWLGGVGTALITIGEVMQDVGAVVELVGQYGQTAANITKTAAYAAEGNLMGAAMSAASAIQSGTAAVKGTKELKGTFGKINDEAQAATQKIAAREAAKETVAEATKGMTKDEAKQALGGMSEKQARKFVTADLRNTMAQNKELKGKNLNELREYLSTSSNGATGTVATSSFESVAEKSKTIIKNSASQKAANKAIKAEIKALTPKSNMDWGGNITALGNSVTNIASVLATNDTMNTFKAGGKKKLAPAHLDARTRRIMEKNQRYRAIRHSYAA